MITVHHIDLYQEIDAIVDEDDPLELDNTEEFFSK